MNPTPERSHPESAKPVPTVVVAVNQTEPVDTGIRVEVERVTLEEYMRRQQADREQAEREQAERAAATRATAAIEPSTLPNDPAVLQRMIAELVAALQGERQENAELRHHLDELTRRWYGPRPQRFDANQPLLFPELDAEASAAAALADDAEETTADDTDADSSDNANNKKKSKNKKNSKPHGRRRLEELLASLPVDRKECTLTEAERLCPCCGGLRKKIGAQTTQQLDYQPAHLVRVEHVQFTYSCPHCPEHIVTAPKPPQPIDRGLPGPGLLAAMITQKYEEHKPLYRQEMSFWREGAFLSRSTICGWAAGAAELLKPLVERMKHWICQSDVIQTDSTPVSVLIRGSPKTQTGHLWPYLGDRLHPYVVFDFSTDGTNEHAAKFLADYHGYVQVDASSGYDILFRPGSNKIEVGCWAHAERKFKDARDSDPVLACQAMGFVQALYQIEARARDKILSVDDVLQLRQSEAVPILTDFKKWLDATVDKVLPKSPLGQAIGYVRNQWQALNRYTEAGFLNIDNNAVERTNKHIARGRINWLFVGSPKGGQTAAILFSITATCKRLEMDAFAYLRDLFTLLPTPDRKPLPPDQLDQLLPDRWLASHPEARYPPQRRRQANDK